MHICEKMRYRVTLDYIGDQSIYFMGYRRFGNHRSPKMFLEKHHMGFATTPLPLMRTRVKLARLGCNVLFKEHWFIEKNHDLAIFLQNWFCFSYCVVSKKKLSTHYFHCMWCSMSYNFTMLRHNSALKCSSLYQRNLSYLFVSVSLPCSPVVDIKFVNVCATLLSQISSKVPPSKVLNDINKQEKYFLNDIYFSFVYMCFLS